ncbi:MAG TPA: 2Fe-2S iron-sulfur cluster-binding protein [Desulfosporosinus sp.]|nr:2Fe-2S iron-sulfur cluster-binding protein [Desulfosporosinus sp.]
MESVTVIINGKECIAQKGEFLIDVAKRNGIGIPHLCHHESLRGLATCRICIVEAIENGKKRVVTSCVFPVMRDMVVETNTEEIKGMRRTLLSFLKAEAPENDQIELMIKTNGVGDYSRFAMNHGNDCIMCGLCVKACEELGCNAISTINRGITKEIATPYEEPSSECIGCGSCAYVCPTGCIKMEEGSGIRKIWGKEFKLLKCSECGHYIMSKEQYEHANQKLEIPAELICENCKKKLIAKKIVEIC